MKKLFNKISFTATFFLTSFLLVLIPASYAQNSNSSGALPSITSLLLDDVEQIAQDCSNPLLPDYQIGLVFPGFASITVTAGSLDDVVLSDSAGITATQKLAFLRAACFWQNVIVGDIIDGPNRTSVCQRQPFGGSQFIIDDLLIFIDIEAIDGPGGSIGVSGPCDIQGGFPKAGIMSFDSVDLAALESRGVLDAVVRHEMGHVLGIGTLWGSLGLIQDALPSSQPNLNLPQPKFIGINAVAQYNLLGGTGNFVPIENGFINGVANGATGPGTINGHLAQSALGTQELMTFQIGSNDPLLSRVTIGSLQDLGYFVDYSQADDLPLP